MHVTANISGTGTEWNVRAAAYLRCISDAVLCNVLIAQGSFLKSRANTQRLMGKHECRRREPGGLRAAGGEGLCGAACAGVCLKGKIWT